MSGGFTRSAIGITPEEQSVELAASRTRPLTRLAQRAWAAGRGRGVRPGRGRGVMKNAPLHTAEFDAASLQQTTPTTCGSMSLLAAHRLLHPEAAHPGESDVARWTRGGFRAGTGWIWPWPRFFGTSPWSTARAMERITSVPYRVHRVDAGSEQARRAVVPLIRAALDGGLPVPAYVGNDSLPRHVVLIMSVERDAASPADDGAPETFTIFEPSAGVVQRLTTESLARGEFALGGWRRLWAVVLPA